jgi:hypothetical protein
MRLPSWPIDGRLKTLIDFEGRLHRLHRGDQLALAGFKHQDGLLFPRLRVKAVAVVGVQTHSTIGQAICGKPGTKWWSPTEKPGMRFTGFGMITEPCGNSPICSRCGVTSPPKRARISRSASAWIRSGDVQGCGGTLPRVIVRRCADAAEAEDDILCGQRLLQRGGDARRLVAQIVGPGKTKPSLGKGLDHERQVLVLALSDEELVADDESAEHAMAAWFSAASCAF